MSEPKHPGEVPDTCEELAAIHERQKARGKDEPDGKNQANLIALGISILLIFAPSKIPWWLAS